MYISQFSNAPAFKMKKEDLNPVNRYVYDTCFQTPRVKTSEGIITDIRDIKSEKEFDITCNHLVQKIIPNDFNFGGCDKIKTWERQSGMGQWYYNIIQDGNKKSCSNAMRLMILMSLINNLDADEGNVPPQYNEKIYIDTINQIRKNLNKGKGESIDFETTYRTNLENPGSITEKSGKWQVNGNIHTYSVNGKKLFCLEIEDGEVSNIWNPNEYIQTTKNIPPRAAYIILAHSEYCHLPLGYNVEDFVDRKLEEIEEIRKFYPIPENASTQEILDAVGIKYKKDEKDGKLIIDHYGRFSQQWTFYDLGVEETELFKDIKGIEGDACFKGTDVTNLGSVEFIGGNASFEDSEVEDLGELKKIGGNAYFRHSKIKSLKNVESIIGRAFLQDSQVTDLGKLKYLGKGANIGNKNLKPSDFKDVECHGDIWVLPPWFD